MTNLDSILKSRDITLLRKVHLFKAMVFPVVIYGCESWTVKKAEHWRIDDFELWCWRKLLRVPWIAATAAKSLQSCPTLCDPIDGSPPGSSTLGFSRQEYWSGVPLPSPPLDCKEIQIVHPKGNQSWIFFGRTDVEAETPILWPPDSLEKTLMLGKIEGRRRRLGEMVGWHHRLNGHEFEQALGVVDDREAWRAAVYGVAKSQIWLRDWTDLKVKLFSFVIRLDTRQISAW